MERIITNYTASDRTIVLNNAKALAAITIENVRNIINETQKKTDGKPIPPLVSSGYKQNITSVAYDSTHESVTITLASTVPAIASGDKLTIKVDMGEDIMGRLNEVIEQAAVTIGMTDAQINSMIANIIASEESEE